MQSVGSRLHQEKFMDYLAWALLATHAVSLVIELMILSH
jgi:hypothetical protein